MWKHGSALTGPFKSFDGMLECVRRMMMISDFVCWVLDSPCLMLSSEWLEKLSTDMMCIINSLSIFIMLFDLAGRKLETKKRFMLLVLVNPQSGKASPPKNKNINYLIFLSSRIFLANKTQGKTGIFWLIKGASEEGSKSRIRRHLYSHGGRSRPSIIMHFYISICSWMCFMKCAEKKISGSCTRWTQTGTMPRT